MNTLFGITFTPSIKTPAGVCSCGAGIYHGVLHYCFQTETTYVGNATLGAAFEPWEILPHQASPYETLSSTQELEAYLPPSWAGRFYVEHTCLSCQKKWWALQAAGEVVDDVCPEQTHSSLIDYAPVAVKLKGKGDEALKELENMSKTWKNKPIKLVVPLIPEGKSEKGYTDYAWYQNASDVEKAMLTELRMINQNLQQLIALWTYNPQKDSNG